MHLVISVLATLLTFKLINPLMINYPDNVPDIVEVCPEANKPMAQINLAPLPNEFFKTSPAVVKLISWVECLNFAKVEIKARFIKNETNKEKIDSIDE